MTKRFLLLLSALLLSMLFHASSANAQDSGWFVRSGTSSLSSPIANQTLLYDETDGALKVWNGFYWNRLTIAPALSTLRPPTTTDDITQGWNAGNIWVNSSSGVAYVCTSNLLGAATWENLAGNVSSIGSNSYTSGSTTNDFHLTTNLLIPNQADGSITTHDAIFISTTNPGFFKFTDNSGTLHIGATLDEAQTFVPVETFTSTPVMTTDQIQSSGAGLFSFPSSVNSTSVVSASSRSANEFVTYINSSGVPQVAYIAFGDLPTSTKGYLYGYSTTGAAVPVGTDGQKLIADSTQTTGLNYTNGLGGSGTGGTGGCPTSGTLIGPCWQRGNWTQTGPLTLSHARMHIFGNATFAYLTTIQTELAGGAGTAAGAQGGGSGVGLGGGDGGIGANDSSGAGGGHGAAGGRGMGSNYPQGGGVYDLDSLLAGSGGGGGTGFTTLGGAGGSGGGGFLIECHGNITIGGDIIALGGKGGSGTASSDPGGGGGSGGGVELNGSAISFASSTQQTDLIGSSTAAQTFTLTFSSGAIGAPTYTAITGDTTTSIAANLCANINTALASSGINATSSGATIKINYPSAMSAVTITASGTGTQTVASGSGGFVCDLSGGYGGNSFSSASGNAGGGGGCGLLRFIGVTLDTSTNSPGFNFNGGPIGIGITGAAAGGSFANSDQSLGITVICPSGGWTSTVGSGQSSTTGYASSAGEARSGN